MELRGLDKEVRAEIEKAAVTVRELRIDLEAGNKRLEQIAEEWLDVGGTAREKLVAEFGDLWASMRLWACALPKAGRREVALLLDARCEQVQGFQDDIRLHETELEPVVARLNGARAELDAARYNWRMSEASRLGGGTCQTAACQLARSRIQKLEKKARPLRESVEILDRWLVRIQREIEEQFGQRVGVKFHYLKKASWRESVAQAEGERLAAWAAEQLGRL